MTARPSFLVAAAGATWLAFACGDAQRDASDRETGGTAAHAFAGQGGVAAGSAGATGSFPGNGGNSAGVSGATGTGGSHMPGSDAGNGGAGAADGAGAAGTGNADSVGGAAGNAGASSSDAGTTSNGRAAGSAGSASAGNPDTEGGAANGGERGASVERILVPNWSVRKRMRPATGGDFVLEEVLQSFAESAAAPSRIRELTVEASAARVWIPPAGTFIADFCRHPSAEFSAVLVAEDKTISIARLAADLTLLSVAEIHDPDVAGDPHADASGVSDLRGASLAPDPARVAARDETAVVAVTSSLNAVIAYRLEFDGGKWSAPARTLLEPPAALTPFLPIGGSFDTFGAVVVWFRPVLDVDEAGNAYVAVWAGRKRIPGHVDAFHDGLAALPGDPSLAVAHSDLLLTKMSPDGARVWSRVVGTEHEDEPYAIRAHDGVVAVVGRSRRFPDFDNTFWDALLSVTTSAGELVGTRTLPLNASSILLAVDTLPSGGFLLAGSDGWSQNPSGLSVLSNGSKLLLGLSAFAATPVRHSLEQGPRHNEVRAVLSDSRRVWFGGHEDGPIMHTGDADPSQIHATGVLGSLGLP